MKQKTTTIAVADDDIYWHSIIEFHLMNKIQYDLLFSSWNGLELLKKLENRQVPDILIVDLFLPLICGMEVFYAVRESCPQIKIIAISKIYQEGLVEQLKNKGASGFALKDEKLVEIKLALDMIEKGGHYFSEKKEIVLNRSEEDNPLQQLELRSRDIKIMELTANGMSAGEIAGEVGISTRTVESERIIILKKMRSKNCTEMVAKALRLGLIPALTDS